MNVETLAFALGALLVLVGILGGGFEIKEIKVPVIDHKFRWLAGFAGSGFVTLAVVMHFSDRPEPDRVAGADSHVSRPTTQPPVEIPNRSDAPVKGTAYRDPKTILEANEFTKGKLIAAIRNADEIQNSAYYRVDGSRAADVYSGEALRTVVNDIDTLKQKGWYREASMDNQEFKSFRISDSGKEAEVSVVEYWADTYFDSKTRKCIFRIPRRQVPQTLYLKLSDAGEWTIDAMLHELAPETTATRCE